MKLDAFDIEIIRAAASLAAHAPERMVAAHLAPKLEELARRLELELQLGGEPGGETGGETGDRAPQAMELPRAA